MNINNFEDMFAELTLYEGKRFFSDGRVSGLKKNTDGRFSAYVGIDEESFTVEITLDSSGNVLKSSCSCPYDINEFCSHKAAALYAIRYCFYSEEIEHQSNTIETLFSALSGEELADIFKQMLLSRPDIKDEFMKRLAASKKIHDEEFANLLLQESEINSCVKFLEEAEADAARGNGEQAIKTLEAVITDAYENLTAKPETALKLSVYAVKSLIKITERIFGSLTESGSAENDYFLFCFSLMRDTFSFINEDAAEKEKDEAFQFLIKSSEDFDMETYVDLKFEILNICAVSCYNDYHFSYMKNLLKKHYTMCDVGDYEYYKLKQLELEMFLYRDNFENVELFMKENIFIPEFREKYIAIAMNVGNYEGALKAAREGAEENRENIYLYTRWREYEFSCYICLGRLEEAREIARSFVKNESLDFYHELKASYNNDKYAFQKELQKICDYFEKQPPTQFYGSILVEEKIWNRLMLLCEKNCAYIQHYYQYLYVEYPERVGEVFRNYIFELSEKAANRRQYKKICKMIEIYKSVSGKYFSKSIISELRKRYKKKPAFEDELRKLQALI